MSTGDELLKAVVVEKSGVRAISVPSDCSWRVALEPSLRDRIQVCNSFGWRNYSLANLADGDTWELGIKAERDGRGRHPGSLIRLRRGTTFNAKRRKIHFLLKPRIPIS